MEPEQTDAGNMQYDEPQTSKLKEFQYSMKGYNCTWREIALLVIAVIGVVLAAVAIALAAKSLEEVEQLRRQLQVFEPIQKQPATSKLTANKDKASNFSLPTLYNISLPSLSNNTEIQELSAAVKELRSAVEAVTSTGSVGASYVRWGRPDCPNDAELLYSGFAGGSSSGAYQLSGGGLNYLCLPTDPEYNKWDPSEDHLAASWLYSAEFMSFNVGIFEAELHGGIPACSLCRAPRSAKVMIPGKRTCPDGWTREYEGYLMSSSVVEHKTTFECVDSNPKIIEGTSNSTGGAWFYFTSGYCNGNGALSYCPPYVHARELTCVVCTS